MWLCRARSTYRIVWWLSCGKQCPSTYDGKVLHVPALCCLPSVGAVQCPDSGVPVVLE